MNEYKNIANKIIDKLLDAVCEQHPEIDQTEKSLLYGESYYLLENEIADMIQDKYPKKCHICHKVMTDTGDDFCCNNEKCVDYKGIIEGVNDENKYRHIKI